MRIENSSAPILLKLTCVSCKSLLRDIKPEDFTFKKGWFIERFYLECPLCGYKKNLSSDSFDEPATYYKLIKIIKEKHLIENSPLGKALNEA